MRLLLRGLGGGLNRRTHCIEAELQLGECELRALTGTTEAGAPLARELSLEPFNLEPQLANQSLQRIDIIGTDMSIAHA